MTPYWQSSDGRHVIYCKDCRDIWPGLAGSFDCVLTDPPYGLGEVWKGGGGGGSWGSRRSEFLSWDGQTVEGVEDLANAAPEVIIWGGQYYHLPPRRCWLIWDKKRNDVWTGGQAEMAWTNLNRPIRLFRLEAGKNCTPDSEKLHPAQKPLSLMRWCLKWTRGQTVFDPFMGSGTTGIACIREGRRFVGVEIEERYAAIAVKRMETELAQPMLPFATPEPTPESAGLFDG